MLGLGKEFAEVTAKDHQMENKWMEMFWYSRDLTFVCPTEIAEFNRQFGQFRVRDAVLHDASKDSEFVHAAW